MYRILIKIIIIVEEFVNKKLKENFNDFNTNLAMYKMGKTLSKIYTHKKISLKRTYATGRVDKDSEYYKQIGNHFGELQMFKKKNSNILFVVIGNLTTSAKNAVKIAEPGVLHKDKPVYLYDKKEIIKIDLLEGTTKLDELVKDFNVSKEYSTRVQNNKEINEKIIEDSKKEIEKKYGCKDLEHITKKITSNEGLDKLVATLKQDIHHEKID